MELRPLGFGEIFDRGVTLYLRNFVAFLAIVLVLMIPATLVQYVVDANQSAQFARILGAMEHTVPARKPSGSNEVLRAVKPSQTDRIERVLERQRPVVLRTAAAPVRMPAVSAAEIWSVVFALLLFAVLLPFATNAVGIGVARLYRGQRVSFRSCYAAVLPRWLSMLAMVGLEVLTIFGWYVAFVMVVVPSMLMLLPAFRVGGAPAAIAFVAMLLEIFVLLLLLAPIVVALDFGMLAIVIERMNAAEAFRAGFARVFTRPQFGRAVLFALALGTISLGVSIVSGLATSGALAFHQVALAAVLTSLLRAAYLPFSAVTLAIYYFDVRVRLEGFDIEAAIDRLAVPAESPL